VSVDSIPHHLEAEQSTLRHFGADAICDDSRALAAEDLLRLGRSIER